MAWEHLIISLAGTMNFCIYMVRSRNTCNIKSHSMHRNMHMHQTMGWNSLWQLTLLFVCLLPTRVWMPAWTSFLYSSGITESCAWFHRKRNRSRNTNMYWNTLSEVCTRMSWKVLWIVFLREIVRPRPFGGASRSHIQMRYLISGRNQNTPGRFFG